MISFTAALPDVNSILEKSGAIRKPRRIGGWRLGDKEKTVLKKAEWTEAGKDEDQGTHFYLLSNAASLAFRKIAVKSLGIAVKKGKVVSLYAELKEDPSQMITRDFGNGSQMGPYTVWADHVTTIFVKGNLLILSDTHEALMEADSERIQREEADQEKGFLKRMYDLFINPQGRIGQKSYIIASLITGIPAAILFALAWMHPEALLNGTSGMATAGLVAATILFISLLSLSMRRISDLGKSHLLYWAAFILLIAVKEGVEHVTGDSLLGTHVAGVLFFILVIVLACIPGQKKKNKYGPVPGK